VTAVLTVPETVAVNCKVLVAATEADVGETEMATTSGSGGAGEEEEAEEVEKGLAVQP